MGRYKPKSKQRLHLFPPQSLTVPQFLGSDADSDSSQDDFNPDTVRDAWDLTGISDDPLIFGSSHSAVNLSTLHPDPAQIFRLWQIFLDNVNPLLRVIHAPTMQGRIIEAINDLENASPTIHALMFSIYSMAVLSLVSKQCASTFGMTKDDALARYQFACRQALLRSGFLRTSDRDCLTALYIYLVSCNYALLIFILIVLGLCPDHCRSPSTVIHDRTRNPHRPTHANP